MTTRTRLAIVLCTFHREALLAKALDSLSQQPIPQGLEVEILVVDNSDAGTAREIVNQKAAASPVPMRWLAAHPANIAVARNAGVAATSADFIAFLDDDQQAASDWLRAVAENVRNGAIDAWFGAITPQFEAGSALTPMTRTLFSRWTDRPAGDRLVALGPGKTAEVSLSTANSLFRRAAMLIGPGPFDPAFGNGGGEDYDLICRMQQRGSKMTWQPEMQASEFVPASRCDPSYLRGRFYAGGQAFAEAAAKASAAPGLMRWIVRAKALVQAGLLSLKLPAAAWRGGASWLDHSYVWAGVLGKLSFGQIKPIYRASDPRPAEANR
ncbi:MAG TPA: glycosyltransferase [Beijerinckiaceae bacterium]|nr:glycosyltransferase [Beijerinckiaceae bacterium]